MNKLALNLDDLQIDSFVPSNDDSAHAGGTVHGHGKSKNTNCLECEPQFTLALHDNVCIVDSLQETCGLSCGGTCLPEDCLAY
jgi:hypothetical protein